MTSLVLAAIEFVQGLSVALYQSVEVVRKDITRTARKHEQKRKLAESVRADMERL